MSSLIQPHHQYRSIIISPSFKPNHLLSYNNNSHSLLLSQKSNFCTKPPNATNDNDNNNEDKEDESEWEYREVDTEINKTRNYQILSWRTVFATIVVFGIGTIIFQQRVHTHRQKQKKAQIVSYGEAAIGGGQWKMTDHNGKEIDQSTMAGKYQVVYFGFTFCPDVCPRELTKMANVCFISLCSYKIHSI